MILASLLLPIAVAAIVFLIQRVRLPAFLAIMATVVVYGIAAEHHRFDIAPDVGQRCAQVV